VTNCPILRKKKLAFIPPETHGVKISLKVRIENLVFPCYYQDIVLNILMILEK